jgi:hypothetical protein
MRMWSIMGLSNHPEDDDEARREARQKKGHILAQLRHRWRGESNLSQRLIMQRLQKEGTGSEWMPRPFIGQGNVSAHAQALTQQ